MVRDDNQSWPPLADEIVNLPVDELALRMLRYIFYHSQQKMARMNIAERHSDINVQRALVEAFDWLYFHGFLGMRPDRDNWLYVTKRGAAAAQDPNASANIRAEKRIDLDLHPKLATKIRRQFLLGEYDSAVFLAFRE